MITGDARAALAKPKTFGALAELAQLASQLAGWRVYDCLGPFGAEKFLADGTWIQLYNNDAHALFRRMWEMDGKLMDHGDHTS